MYIIRADGNSTIGMGHIMRCLSIADAMIEQGITPVFVTACKECISTIEARGFMAMLLPTDYRNMEEEIPYIEKIIRDNKNDNVTDVILTDSYQVTNSYYEQLGRFAAVVCLEDMGTPYNVDVLINYNIYAPTLREKYELTENTPKHLCLGTEYMPLRKEFQDTNEYQINDKVTNVMITTGGSDPLYASKDILDSLLNCSELEKEHITYNVISGPMNAFAQQLKNDCKDIKTVVIHENVKSMKDEMLKNDVIITATGSTIYEASALGVPMICFHFVENQRQGAQMIGKITDVINCGDLLSEKQQTLENITKALVKCCNSKEYRSLLSCQGKKLVDGQGASRVASIIGQL